MKALKLLLIGAEYGDANSQFTIGIWLRRRSNLALASKLVNELENNKEDNNVDVNLQDSSLKTDSKITYLIVSLIHKVKGIFSGNIFKLNNGLQFFSSFNKGTITQEFDEPRWSDILENDKISPNNTENREEVCKINKNEQDERPIKYNLSPLYIDLEALSYTYFYAASNANHPGAKLLIANRIMNSRGGVEQCYLASKYLIGVAAEAAYTWGNHTTGAIQRLSIDLNKKSKEFSKVLFVMSDVDDRFMELSSLVSDALNANRLYRFNKNKIDQEILLDEEIPNLSQDLIFNIPIQRDKKENQQIYEFPADENDSEIEARKMFIQKLIENPNVAKKSLTKRSFFTEIITSLAHKFFLATDGFPNDFLIAADLFKQCGNLGVSECYALLGYMHAHGMGFPIVSYLI